MIFDEINIFDLSSNSEAAFLQFEKRLRKAFETHREDDRREHAGQDGEYTGSYMPHRSYVSTIIAFIDEYNLDIKTQDITPYTDEAFYSGFSQFLNEINYARTRLSLRKIRHESGAAGTPVLINSSYKDEITNALNTIKKIVNQEIKDENKKDKIFSKISALQSEIDRDRTTVDAIFSRMIDLSKVVGECAEHIDPLVEKMERLKKLFWDKTEKVKTLPPNENTKMISSDSSLELDDDVPF